MTIEEAYRLNVGDLVYIRGQWRVVERFVRVYIGFRDGLPHILTDQGKRPLVSDCELVIPPQKPAESEGDVEGTEKPAS